MEARPQQPRHGLAVAAGDLRPQIARLIRPIQTPVLLELPHQEAEDPGDARPDAEGDGGGQGGVHGQRQGRRHGRHEERQHQLVRHRHDREMLDRIDLRLDQQVDAEADDVGDEEPDEAQHRLDRHRPPAVAAAEAQPLIDGVEQPLHAVEQPAEEGQDQPEQAGDHVRARRAASRAASRRRTPPRGASPAANAAAPRRRGTARPTRSPRRSDRRRSRTQDQGDRGGPAAAVSGRRGRTAGTPGSGRRRAPAAGA